MCFECSWGEPDTKGRERPSTAFACDQPMPTSPRRWGLGRGALTMRAPDEGPCFKEIWPTPRDDQAPTLGETGDEPAGDARVRYYDMTKRYEVTPASAIKFARPHKKTAKVTGFAQSVVRRRLTLAQQAARKSPPGVQASLSRHPRLHRQAAGALSTSLAAGRGACLGDRHDPVPLEERHRLHGRGHARANIASIEGKYRSGPVRHGRLPAAADQSLHADRRLSRPRPRPSDPGPDPHSIVGARKPPDPR